MNFLADYQPPSYLIPKVELIFDIRETTTVRSTLQIEHNQNVSEHQPLHLNGSEELNPIEVRLNGTTLAPDAYELIDNDLVIQNVPSCFTLEITTEINPAANQSGFGLYQANNTFCTQMQAEGFRKVTYFADRPDVLSIYKTTIVADNSLPVLLSNGNLIEQGELEEGRHYAIWHDPFPKPCYLFALVAGDLGVVQDSFVTMNGREVALAIYVDMGNQHLCQHALDSLKRAMKWDEDRFGREYDLNLFMIVAVRAFNFQAMENKGLNIFNDSAVFADSRTATDEDFLRIEGVVAHEYFHNWTGNRITCRDWFQLTLKEGLTVFRDQLFSADMNSAAVKRIQDVKRLKTLQFPEDAGPNAHPIQPQSYIEIDNFYTNTVYDKGAEVIRMIYTFIGAEEFRRGMDNYFSLYDGQAVTTDDFIHAMHLASEMDFTQFKRWYTQAGTPVCSVELIYHEQEKACELIVKQSCPPTPGQPVKLPFYFPLSIALLGQDGREIDQATTILPIELPEHRFRFEGINQRPVPSLLRNFSAPVKLEYPYTDSELLHLLNYDTDLVNRYEVGQRLALKAISLLMETTSSSLPTIANTIAALGNLLGDSNIDPAFRAEVLAMPPLVTIVEAMNPIDYQLADNTREAFITEFAQTTRSTLVATLEAYSKDPVAIGKRALKNLILFYLTRIDANFLQQVYQQLQHATNMTDEYAALKILVDYNSDEKNQAIELWSNKWHDNPLVMDKWFQAQAGSRLASIELVERLEEHPAFDRTNPNKLRALYETFARNPIAFHTANGEGYRLIANKVIEIDRFNSTVAARLATTFYQFDRLDSVRKDLMKNELERILDTEDISSKVKEVVFNTFYATMPINNRLTDLRALMREQNLDAYLT